MLFAALLVVAQRPPVAPLVSPEACVFSAIPVCGAGHQTCRGRATLNLPTEYGPVEIDAREVVCGESFVLSARRAPLTETQRGDLTVEISLEGHAAVRLRSVPLRNGCDLGPWRAPEGPNTPSEPPLPVQEMGPRCLRVELRGEPSDAITGFTIPDDDTGPMMCGLAYHSIVNPDHGVRRVDRRTWELDLDRLRVKGGSFRLFVHTLSGASVQTAVDGSAFVANRAQVVCVQAPPAHRLIRGRVVDRKGAPVAGAEVSASLPASTAVLLTRSDDEGRFAVVGLAESKVRLRVNDRAWRDVESYGRITEAQAPPGDEIEIVVDRQRRIEIDARALRLDPDLAVLVSMAPLTSDGRLGSPCFVACVDPRTAAAPFRIPAEWGGRFDVSLVPVPADGRIYSGKFGDRVQDARIASTRIGLPIQGSADIVRFWRVKPVDR